MPNQFQAIIVGSGITGGLAAKELCEKGVKTLLLERGRNVEHIVDYTTANLLPWEFEHRLQFTNEQKITNPLQTVISDPGNAHFFANDVDHPFIQEKPFNWTRGYQVGGRSLTWGRQCLRLSDLDFNANVEDGFGVDWPVRYNEIAPWYDYVENYIGVSGRNEGLAHLPDGVFLPPMEMSCVEDYFAEQIRSKYEDRIVTIGRVANLTRGWQNRGPCQYRNLCSRGCPFGGYYSSNSASLPAAFATGNLTLQPDAIVAEVLYDNKTKKATGVRVIDANSKKVTDYFANIIFLNASAIATTSILLNSKSSDFPDGLGNSSGQVGRNLMDHFVGTGAEAEFDGFTDKYHKGRRPIGIYVPRFRNISAKTKHQKFVRGYVLQGKGERMGWREQGKRTKGFGGDFKKQLLQPGPWSLWLGGWGETLPYSENRVSLNRDKKDKWGLPLVSINFEYGDNEKAMQKDIHESIREMMEQSGFKSIQSYSQLLPGGSAVHEMGTARMGKDPKTSVLNKNNQMHDVKNVFITDGSFMTSSGTANPSLTYMAFTARACDFAVSELKKGNL